MLGVYYERNYKKYTKILIVSFFSREGRISNLNCVLRGKEAKLAKLKKKNKLHEMF